MKRITLVLFCAMLSLAFAGESAHAQIDDHLKCYKIKDSIEVRAKVDLYSPQFGLEKGCRVVRAELFCVPATKRVLKAVDVSASPPVRIDPLPVFGPPAPGDRICYRIMCEDPEPSELAVADQFGHRRIMRQRADLLCTPAVKGPPPPECGPTSAGQCGGRCPSGLECQSVPGTNDCDCLPPPPPCERSAPQCNGPCPPGLVCVGDATGAACACRLPEPIPCERSAPQCNGPCPPGLVCVGDATGAACACRLPEPIPCERSAPACNGPCPPELQCVTKPDTNECVCEPLAPRPCDQSPFPACGGECPTGTVCGPLSAANACGCQNIPQATDANKGGKKNKP